MPRGDRSGPYGTGPRSGRSLGFCSGYEKPGYIYSGLNFSFGRGMFGCRGRGRWQGRVQNMRYMNSPMVYSRQSSSTPQTPEEKLSILNNEKKFLESEMNNIKNGLVEVSKRIQELEKID